MNRQELEAIVNEANTRFTTLVGRYKRVIQQLNTRQATYNTWETNKHTGLSVKTSNPDGWTMLKLDGHFSFID